VKIGSRHTPAGFVLWEIMLAVTIFAVVAVALSAALQQTAETSILLRDESQVRLEMQNLLAEAAVDKPKPGRVEIQSGDGRIRYEREIRPVKAKNARGEVLPDLYEIVILASWRSSGRERSDRGSLTLYRP
jgi:type II secretory pathway component PulJ